MFSNVDLNTLIVKGAFTKNWAKMIPKGLNTKRSPTCSRVSPGGVVKNNSKPTPATSGGKAKGKSTRVLIRLFKGMLYLASEYAIGTPMIITRAVDMIEVKRLNFIANCISWEVMLSKKSPGVVWATMHTSTVKIKAARSKVRNTVRTSNFDLFNLARVLFIWIWRVAELL